MPRVPVYDSQQIAARGVPAVQQSHISTSVPDGTQALARGIAGAAHVMQREQAYANDLRAEETFNTLRERMLDLTLGQENGYTNVKGRNALGIVPQYEERYNGAVQELEGTLANDAQKQLFRRYATRAGLEFKGGLMRHSNSEADSWRKQTVDGVFATEADVAAKNWNNPEAIDLSRGRIDLNIGKLRDADGLPAEQVSKIRLGALTKLHSGVLSNLLANDQFDAAKAYMDKYKDEIDSGVLLKGNEEVRKLGDQKYAFLAANNAVSPAVQALNTDDFGRLVHLVGGRESGNRERDAAGNLITSSAGAQGKMQVMPGTNKDPGYGVVPARDDSDAERTRVGRDYLAAMIKNYGGDVAKALAAYNAGPGAVDEAIKNARDGNWLAALPKETRDYVPAILSKYQAGLGAPQRETFADVDARLKADPRLASNPVAYKQAREFALQQFNEQEKAFDQRAKEREGTVYRELVANGGDFNALPASLRAGMDPTKIDSAMKFAATLRKGEETVTNPALYQMLATNPHQLRGMTDNEFFALRKDLSETDFKHFANERAKVQGKAVTAGEDLNSEALNRVLNLRLQSLGIDPTPKDTDTDAMQRVGALRNFVTRSVLDSQRTTGVKMSDADVMKHIDGLFANNTQLRDTFLGISTGARPVATLMMKPGDVPDDARDQIKKAFKGAGLPDPSPTQILEVYWAKKFSPQSALKQAKAPSLASQIPK